MPKDPYPSQIAPKPPKRSGKTMIEKDMIKKPAYGMSSTSEQRKMARMQMTNDMKKRGMLRKKKGQ